MQQKWAESMSENLALLGKYMNMMFMNVLLKMWKLKAKSIYIRYSATYRPICTKLAQSLWMTSGTMDLSLLLKALSLTEI